MLAQHKSTNMKKESEQRDSYKKGSSYGGQKREEDCLLLGFLSGLLHVEREEIQLALRWCRIS